MIGYILLVYFVTYATRRLGLALPTALMLIVLASVVGAPGTVLFAHWSDRIGRRRIMQWGLGALVLWSLVFFPLVDTGSIPLIALSLCGMMFLQGAYLGPQPAVFSELFPAAIRYSGASLSLTLGTIFGGALAPFIATTPGLEGRPVQEYLGIVSGEAALSVGYALPGARAGGQPVRGRPVSLERRIHAARERAVDAMAGAARALGAHAVLAVDVRCTTMRRPRGGDLLLVTASGTAVTL